MVSSCICKAPALLAFVLLLSACDSTPRERQAAARDGLSELDTAVRHTGRSLRRVASAASRLDSLNRARKSQPLKASQQLAADQYLLGPYKDKLGSLTAATIPDAYAQLLRQTRASRRQWGARDWDYAANTYQRLNAELARVRLDLPARDELRIRAWQAEFKALQANRSVKELQALTTPANSPAASR
jgi:hypothetical protein